MIQNCIDYITDYITEKGKVRDTPLFAVHHQMFGVQDNLGNSSQIPVIQLRTCFKQDPSVTLFFSILTGCFNFSRV